MTDPEIVSVLRPDGTVDPTHDPGLPDAEMLSLYRHMVLLRAVDEKAVALQRSGRIAFFAPSTGQEACSIGAGHAVREGDWIFPGYRDHGVGLMRGYPLAALFGQIVGHTTDTTRGRQMPNHWCDRSIRLVSVSSPVATQLPHAVGAAYAAKVRGERIAVLTTFGDGATSTGDFHAAMNFTGVFRLPVVFFCENNRYAISHPVERQTATGTLAEKGRRTDFPASASTATTCWRSARRSERRWTGRAPGGGHADRGAHVSPRPHSTSDDPTVYRSEEEVAAWRGKDPIRRFAAFLKGRGLLEDPAAEEAGGEGDRAQRGRGGEERPPCRCPACSRMSTPKSRGTSPSSATPSSPGRDEAMAEVTLIKAVNDALATEMARDPSVCVLGEDVGRDGGVFRATEGLLDRFGPERVIDTPLNEVGIVGMAIGMAMNGLRPVAEIEFADFIYPAFDQIVSEMAKMRYRSAGQFTAAVVLRTPSGGGIRGGHYHSQSPEAYFIHTAGLVVVMPSTPADAKGLLSSAIRAEDPGDLPRAEGALPDGKGGGAGRGSTSFRSGRGGSSGPGTT